MYTVLISVLCVFLFSTIVLAVESQRRQTQIKMGKDKLVANNQKPYQVKTTIQSRSFWETVPFTWIADLKAREATSSRSGFHIPIWEVSLPGSSLDGWLNPWTLTLTMALQHMESPALATRATGPAPAPEVRHGGGGGGGGPWRIAWTYSPRSKL